VKEITKQKEHIMTIGTHRERRQPNMQANKYQSKALPPSTPKKKPMSSPSRTPLTVNTKKKKLCSTMALLDQYQEDDDENLTTQLLYSIRSWNLDRPSSSFDGDGVCDGSNSGGCGSSIVTKNSGVGCHASTATATTATLDDLATVTTASTTNNEIVLWNSQSSSTPQQHQHLQEPEFKTPCRGNYSSRPSFLTERILEDDASYDDTMLITASTLSSTESPQNNHNMPLVIADGESSDESHNLHRYHQGLPTSDQRRNIRSRVRFLEEEQYQQQQRQQQQDQHYQRQQDQNEMDNQEHARELQSHEHRITSFMTPITNNIAPPMRSMEQEDHGIHQRSRKHDTKIEDERKSEEEDSQDYAMRTLLEIANSLGLSPDNVGAVLPTVRKMVRVVKIHVPRLEKFVDSVCQIVETDKRHNNDDDGGNATDNGGDLERNGREKKSNTADHGKTRENQGTLKQDQKKQTRRKSKKAVKNMEARRKRMSNVVSVLREEWPNRNATDSTATDISICNMLSHDCQKNDLSSSSQRVSSESTFCRAVIEKLNQRHQMQVGQIIDNVLESTNSKKSGLSSPPENSSIITNIDDALAIIDELIGFEERCHRIETIQKLVTNSSTTSFSSPSSAFTPRSPTNSEDIIEELLAEDATAIRKVVLHFAYLFSVRQNEMRLKMNELYHFSHEAGALIKTMRKAIGVSVNCPLSTVSRRVVDAMHKDLRHSASEELSHRL